MSKYLLSIHAIQGCLFVCGLCNAWPVFNQTNSLNMVPAAKLGTKDLQKLCGRWFWWAASFLELGPESQTMIDEGDLTCYRLPQLKVGGNYPLSAAKAWWIQNFHQPTCGFPGNPLAGCRIWQRHRGTQLAYGTLARSSHGSSSQLPQGWCSAGGESSCPSFFLVRCRV